MTCKDSDLVSWEQKPQCSVHWEHCSPSPLQHRRVLLQAWKDERTNNCDRYQHMPSHTGEVKQARNTTLEGSTAPVKGFCKTNGTDKSWVDLWLLRSSQDCLKLTTNCSSTWQPMEPVMSLWYVHNALILQFTDPSVKGICLGGNSQAKAYRLWEWSLNSYRALLDTVSQALILAITLHHYSTFSSSTAAIHPEFKKTQNLPYKPLQETTSTIISITPLLCISAKTQHMPLTFSVSLAELHTLIFLR